MTEKHQEHKTITAVLCCAVCMALVWWFCYNFQRTITENAVKSGIDPEERTITRVSVPADIDAAVNHGVWARGIAEGQILPSHITVYEHRDRILPYTPIPRIITGLIFMITGNLDKAYDYAVILGPVAAVMMTFILIYRITGSLLYACAFGLGIIIMARLPDQIANDMASLMSGDNPGFTYTKGYLFNGERMDELFISRLEAPALSYFFYALSFYFIFTRYLLNKSGAWITIGIAAGALSLVNLFHFLYASIFCGLLLLSRIITDRKFGLKSLLFFAGGYAAAILPFIALLTYGMLSSWYPDIQSRVHLEIGRQWRSSLNWEYAWALLMGILSLLMHWRLHIKQREIFLWAACLFFVRPVFFNLHLVIGSIPEPDHIERYGTNFGEWIAFCLILYGAGAWLANNQYPFRKILSHLRWPVYAIPAVLICSSLLWIYHAPAARADTVWSRFVRPAGEDQVMRFIKEKSPDHSVFLTTDFETGLRVVAATGRHLFISPSNATLTNREIEERLLRGFKILGLSSEQLRQYLIDDSHQYAIIFANRYLPRYMDSSFNARATDREIPAEKHQEMGREFNRLHFDPSSRLEFLGSLRLDYILVSPVDRDIVNTEVLRTRFGVPLYDKEGYLIFGYRRS